MTEAVLFRLAEHSGGAQFLDEVEHLDADKDLFAGLVAVLNAGFEKGGTVPRSLPQVRSHLKHIREAFGDWRAVEVTEEEVVRYIFRRRAAGAAPATVNRETQLLDQALRPFLKKCRLPALEIRYLPEDNTREGYFERAEIEAVVPHLPEVLQDLTRFGYVTGWRRGELVSLAWANVDREARAIRLSWRKSKNKRTRLMPLEGELWEIIERRWAAREYRTRDGQTVISPYVFHQGGRAIGDFRKSWATACRNAGLGGRLFHDLRRSAIRNMIKAGTARGVAMKISGHRTEAVFERYNITDDEDIREAVFKTQAYVRTLPTERKVLPLTGAIRP